MYSVLNFSFGITKIKGAPGGSARMPTIGVGE